MTNNNNLIPKENFKKVEEVREIKNEVPSFEEFMKTYNENKEVVDSYESEFDSYGDISVRGTYYGPGFWDDIKGVVKPVASAALFAASVFPPTAPVAMTISLTVAGTSVAARGLGHVTDIKELKDFSSDLAEIALTGIEAQK